MSLRLCYLFILFAHAVANPSMINVSTVSLDWNLFPNNKPKALEVSLVHGTAIRPSLKCGLLEVCAHNYIYWDQPGGMGLITLNWRHPHCKAHTCDICICMVWRLADKYKTDELCRRFIPRVKALLTAKVTSKQINSAKVTSKQINSAKVTSSWSRPSLTAKVTSKQMNSTNVRPSHGKAELTGFFIKKKKKLNKIQDLNELYRTVYICIVAWFLTRSQFRK